MNNWIPNVIRCKVCNDPCETRQIAGNAICKICHNDQVAQYRSSPARENLKRCGECQHLRRRTDFRRSATINGQFREACEACWKTKRCTRCKAMVPWSSMEDGLCTMCMGAVNDVLRRFDKRRRVKCASCSGQFEEIEMIDDTCIYCHVNEEDEDLALMRVARRLRHNETLSRKVETYLKNCLRCG